MSLFSKVKHHEDPSSHIPVHHHHHHQKSQTNIVDDRVKLAIELESPPAMLYGHESESTGSIISGLLLLNIDQNPKFSTIDIDHVTLSLVQTIQLSKPFLVSSTLLTCKDCSTRRNILARWDVVRAKSSFVPGSHAYPFSHLLPGALPPSTKLGNKSSVSFIKYDLVAIAKVSDPLADHVSLDETNEVRVTLPLNISRLVLRGPDRNSLRVFPPTDVSATAVLPNVIYPKSTFPVELRMDNMNSKNADRRWRMRKLVWRIEETTRIRATTCEKHESKLKTAEESQRRMKSQVKPKSTNTHHSTILTNFVLAPDTSLEPVADNAAGINGAAAVAVDTTEVERSAPTHAAENFLEDFGNSPALAPVASTNSVNSSRVGSAESPASSNVGPTSMGPNASTSGASGSASSTTDHLYIEENRVVSHGDIKTGWKSDFSSTGKIELVAQIDCMNVSTGLVKPTNKASSDDETINEVQQGLRHGANLACDIEDPNEGIFVSHMLIVELMVAEESVTVKPRRKSKGHKDLGLALEPVSSMSSVASTDSDSPSNSPQQVVGTPTGAARVLRMQFKLNITERSGLGIAWDDEVPPTYEDVRTLSPPTYESSAISTPLFGSVPMRTPGVLYGVGDTPAGSLDHMLEMEDGIQDLSL